MTDHLFFYWLKIKSPRQNLKKKTTNMRQKRGSKSRVGFYETPAHLMDRISMTSPFTGSVKGSHRNALQFPCITPLSRLPLGVVVVAFCKRGGCFKSTKRHGLKHNITITKFETHFLMSNKIKFRNRAASETWAGPWNALRKKSSFPLFLISTLEYLTCPCPDLYPFLFYSSVSGLPTGTFLRLLCLRSTFP